VRGWRTEHRPCPFCRAISSRVLGARGGRAHHKGKGVETWVVRCTECHGVYQRPTLVPEFNPYTECSPEDYFQQHVPEEKIALGEQLAAFAESVLGQPGNMLELGCGRGELLRGAANRGWSVRGVEMTEEFARIASEKHGLEIERSSIDHSQSLRESYDVVLLAAILEHLYEPAETLKQVGNALRRGGLVFIDVPNECSLMSRAGNMYMRLMGKDWATNLSPTFPPFHVVGFCPRSLERLLERTGFRPIKLELHRWNVPLPRGVGWTSLVEHLGLNAALSMGKLIGMGAGITCWAVRR
jgi:SAM-dependent methyltransferase